MVSYYLSTPTRCRVTPCQESFTRITAYVSPAAGDIADVTAYMNHLGQAARAAATRMRRASTAEKNRALLAMGEELERQRKVVLQANAADLARGRENGLDPALLDRLALDDARFDAMIEGLKQVAALPDPV